MKLFRPPSPERLTRQDVCRFLANFPLEARVIQFSDQELGRLTDPKILGRLMDPRTQSFFLYHFGSLFQRAVAALFLRRPSSVIRRPLFDGSRITDAGRRSLFILELGCGSGSGSLLFALLGARVVGLDLDPVLISACRKRQAFYEAEFGPLDLRFELADALSYDYQQLAPIAAIYSLFAFNLMQPSSQLLARILPALAPDGRIVISDGNSHSLYNYLFRPRAVLAPRRVKELLAASGSWFLVPGSKNQEPRTKNPSCGFHTAIEYDCIVPPVLARSRPGLAFGSLVERTLNSIGILRWFGLSYTLTAERSTP